MTQPSLQVALALAVGLPGLDVKLFDAPQPAGTVERANHGPSYSPGETPSALHNGQLSCARIQAYLTTTPA